MFLQIESVVVVTREDGRTGTRTEDHQQHITHRVDLTPLAPLLQPLLETVLSLVSASDSPSRNGHRFPA